MTEKKSTYLSFIYKLSALTIFIGVSGCLIYKETAKYQKNTPINENTYFSSSKAKNDSSVKDMSQSIGNQSIDQPEPPMINSKKKSYQKKTYFSSSKDISVSKDSFEKEFAHLDEIFIDSLTNDSAKKKPKKPFFPSSKSGFLELVEKPKEKQSTKNKPKKKKITKKKKFFPSSKAPFPPFDDDELEKILENEKKKKKNKK